MSEYASLLALTLIVLASSEVEPYQPSQLPMLPGTANAESAAALDTPFSEAGAAVSVGG